MIPILTSRQRCPDYVGLHSEFRFDVVGAIDDPGSITTGVHPDSESIARAIHPNQARLWAGCLTSISESISKSLSGLAHELSQNTAPTTGGAYRSNSRTAAATSDDLIAAGTCD